jgi:hypothetical protein
MRPFSIITPSLVFPPACLPGEKSEAQYNCPFDLKPIQQISVGAAGCAAVIE